MGFKVGIFFLAACAATAQTQPAQLLCDKVPSYQVCEIAFDLAAADAARHPNPYATVELRIEFRSPRHRTFALPAFWDGGAKMVVRLSPTEPGAWDYRVTSNVAAWNGREGSFTAVAGEAPGFIQPVSLHHWIYTERNLAHLWMGASEPRLARLDEAGFRTLADARAAQKFTHLRFRVLGEPGIEPGYSAPDAPELSYFQELDRRVRYLNQKGIIADLVLAPRPSAFTRLFPNPEERRRFIRYVVARYAAFNVTWEALDAFEGEAGGRALLREIGVLLREDPYAHPRTSGARVTSAPLYQDGWMTFVAHGPGADGNVASIERQLFPAPFVNTGMGREDSGAGKSGPADVDAAGFRARLWNATMNGQSPTYANTGSGAQYATSPGALAMTAWFDILSQTRHWEMEPYFDVDGGRALALEDADYLVYIEKPGPVQLAVAKRTYDVYWINPANGEATKEKKQFKGDRFSAEPPDKSHDWVLRLVREGRLESMARSYRFESRLGEEGSVALPIALQEVETIPEKVPFQIEQPAEDLSLSKAMPFSAKITRQTRATSAMKWLWTGEVTTDGQGYRVLASSQEGTMQPPSDIAAGAPATLLLRVYGMNANGKVYELNRACRLTQ